MALNLIDIIITQLDKNETTITVYLYLSKSFDTIDHIIFLDKLKYFGVHGTKLPINHKQYMKINNIKSNMLSITTGVPQALITGLLLYINDFVQASKMLSFLIYADDTTISSTLNMFSYNIHNQNLDYLINE